MTDGRDWHATTTGLMHARCPVPRMATGGEPAPADHRVGVLVIPYLILHERTTAERVVDLARRAGLADLQLARPALDHDARQEAAMPHAHRTA